MKTLEELINDRNEMQRKVYELETLIKTTTDELNDYKRIVSSLAVSIDSMTKTARTYEDFEKIFKELPNLYYDIADYIIQEELINLDGYKITEMCWFDDSYDYLRPSELIDRLDKEFDPYDAYYYRDENGTIYSCNDYSPLNAVKDKIIEYLLTHEPDEYINNSLSGCHIW